MAGTINFCLEKGRFPYNWEHRSCFTPGHSEDGEDEGGVEGEEEGENEEGEEEGEASK